MLFILVDFKVCIPLTFWTNVTVTCVLVKKMRRGIERLFSTIDMSVFCISSILFGKIVCLVSGSFIYLIFFLNHAASFVENDFVLYKMLLNLCHVT